MNPGRVAARVALMAVAAGLACGGAELALRLAGRAPTRMLSPRARARYRLEPGARFVYQGFLPGSVIDFDNPVELNSLGGHDDEIAEARPSEDTLRLLVLGDSYVAALEVPIADTFHQRLEARLARENPLGASAVQMIAFGRGNRAQEAELEWLRELGPRFRPDAVLLVFFGGNDVMENSPVLFARAQRFGARYLREIVPRKLALFDRLMFLPDSRLNGLVAEAATSFYAERLGRFHPELDAEALESPELGVYRTPETDEWRAAFARTSELLVAIRDETVALGARFLLASLAGPQVVGDVGAARLRSGAAREFDPERPERWLAEWAERHGVPAIALGPRLRADATRAFWPHDMHLTPFGHEVVAEALYPFLVGELAAPSPR